MGAHSELLKEKKGKSPPESKDERTEKEGQRQRKGKKTQIILIYLFFQRVMPNVMSG